MSTIDTLFSLEDKVAVVVGGGGQIGQETCRVFLDAGCRVAIVDLDGPHLETLTGKLLAEYPDAVVGVPTDITRAESVEAAKTLVLGRWKQVDVLVNHAHFKGNPRSLEPHNSFFAPFEDYPLDLWTAALEVNLTGMFLCCQAFGRSMLDSGSGSIINTSSTYGLVSPNKSVYGQSGINSPVSYATTKGAIINFTRYIATHWADRGVRANVLCPGGVRNPAQSPDFVEQYERLTPMGRMAEATDYRGAVLFLASDASNYMTGAALTVDGGWTAW